MNPIYKTYKNEDVLELIHSYPLAWIISNQQYTSPTPLPLIAECDDRGSIISLLGHFSRRNPQVEELHDSPEALILFQGPQDYISPGLVSKRDWGPTWNYAVVRFKVRIEFVPNEIDTALTQLAAHLENYKTDPWTVEQMGERYTELKQYIIAFRAHVIHESATFKLGQDESSETFDEIIKNHPNKELTKWMLRLKH